MDNELVIRNLRLQLLIERIVFAVIAFVLTACWATSHFRNSKSLILVDGKPLVCVSSKNDAMDILSRIKAKTGCNPSEISFRQDVRVERAPMNATSVSRHKAFRTVLRAVSPVVPRWAVIADGKPVVAVPNRETAGAVLEAAKMKFGKLVPNLAEEPQFKENVTVDIAAVDPSIYKKTADDAVNYIFSEDTPICTDAIYTVEKGDVAGAIATKCGVKLADLEAMNPRRNLAHLGIGDKLRVRANGDVERPKLTVIVRDMTEHTEAMPAPVQQISSAELTSGKTTVISAGHPGQRKVRVETIYENGKKTGSDVIDEEILHDPVPRRIAVGIKPG